MSYERISGDCPSTTHFTYMTQLDSLHQPRKHRKKYVKRKTTNMSMKIATSNVMISVIVTCWSLGKPPSYLFICLHFPGPKQILLTQTNGSERAFCPNYIHIYSTIYTPTYHLLKWNHQGIFLAIQLFVCSTHMTLLLLWKGLVSGGLTFKNRGHLGFQRSVKIRDTSKLLLDSIPLVDTTIRADKWAKMPTNPPAKNRWRVNHLSSLDFFWSKKTTNIHKTPEFVSVVVVGCWMFRDVSGLLGCTYILPTKKMWIGWFYGGRVKYV